MVKHKTDTPSHSCQRLILPGLCILSFIFTYYSKSLVIYPPFISPVWLIAGLMTSVFFWSAPRRWPQLALPCIIGILSAAWFFPVPLRTNLVFTGVNLLEAVMAAWLLRHLLNHDNPLSRLQDWFILASCGTLVPAVSGATFVTVYLQSVDPNMDVIQTFFNWVSSVAIGNMVLLPIGLLSRTDFSQLRPAAGRWLAELALILFLTLLLSVVIFAYLPWPYLGIEIILMWGAIRLPRLLAFTLFLLTLLCLSALITFSKLTLPSPTFLTWYYSPELPFLLLLLPTSVITLMMSTFKEEQKRIQQSETRFRHAMEYSAIGMALVAVDGRWMQVNKSLVRLLGYSAAQLQNMTFQQLTYPPDIQADLEQLELLITGKIASYSIEKRFYTRHGHVIWTRLTVSVVRKDDQSPDYFITQIKDINDLKKTEFVNNRLMERITLANEAAGAAIWEWDRVNDVLSWDKQMFALYGLSQHLKPTHELWINSLLPDDRQRVEQRTEEALAHKENYQLEFRIQVQDTIRHIRAFAHPVVNQHGDIERLIGINIDMTEVMQLQEAIYQQKEWLHITLNALSEAVICCDTDGHITLVNPAAEQLTGYTQQQLRGQTLAQALHITAGPLGQRIDDLTTTGLPQAENGPILHNPQGDPLDIQYHITPLSLSDGQCIGSVMVIRDITESKKRLEQLSYSATHDALTHLPNRFSFESRLKRLLQTAAEQHQQHVLVFIDLDHFKTVNDSAGHAAGDALLRELAVMVLSVLRPGDTLARLGGDEFGLLLPNCSVITARYLTETLVRRIQRYTFSWEGRFYQVGASAGLTQISSENVRLQEVLSQADLACYTSKNRGRSQVTVYDPNQTTVRPTLSSLTTREQWEMITRQPVTVMAQSMVTQQTFAPTSIYILSLQLTHAGQTVVHESALHNYVRDPVLLYILDRRMLDHIMTQFAARILRQGIAILLPVSGKSLSSTYFVDALLAHLTAHNLPGQQCYLPLSAETLHHASETLRSNLNRLHLTGCHLILSHVIETATLCQCPELHLFDAILVDPAELVRPRTAFDKPSPVTGILSFARHHGMRTFSGPVRSAQHEALLCETDIDLLYGEAISPRLPLMQILTERR